jgi:serine/threonine protein kinase
MRKVAGSSDLSVGYAPIDGGTDLVVLKEPARFSEAQEQGLEKFRQKAENWETVSANPNIVSLIEWGTDPHPWLAMEFLEGYDLRQRIDYADGISVDEALTIVKQLASGLSHMHDNRVIHFDIKPSNIVFDPRPGGPNTPKLSDLEFTRLSQRQQDRDPGDGYPSKVPDRYAAPEEFYESNLPTPGKRADCFSLGIILYELITGDHPFARGDDTSAPVKPQNQWQGYQSIDTGKIPQEVDAVLSDILSHQPSDRPTAREIVQLLDDVSTDDSAIALHDDVEFFYHIEVILGRIEATRAIIRNLDDNPSSDDEIHRCQDKLDSMYTSMRQRERLTQDDICTDILFEDPDQTTFPDIIKEMRSLDKSEGGKVTKELRKEVRELLNQTEAIYKELRR